jgi:hypothetical protein
MGQARVLDLWLWSGEYRGPRGVKHMMKHCLLVGALLVAMPFGTAAAAPAFLSDCLAADSTVNLREMQRP